MKTMGGTVSPTVFSHLRPPGALSFVARRKIEEKGMPRRRKLHILRFAFRGKSSVVPLLLLSPPNPLYWALAGALFAVPFNPPGLMRTPSRAYFVLTFSQ